MVSSDRSVEKSLLDKYGGDIDKIVAVLERLQSDAAVQSKAKKANPEDLGPNIIELRDVSKTYKLGKERIHALKSASLEIRQGEYVAITGPSGSGKSTLLQLIGALDKPTSGLINVDGKHIKDLSDRKLSTFRNQTIGFVFQFFYLQPFLDLQTNLEVPGMFARTPRHERRERSAKLAENVGLSDRLKHLPNELSGGQMQRAAIARGLLNSPKILLADEPTGNLDRENSFAIMELFDQVRKTFGTTVIAVTHDTELAARADRTISVRDGDIV